MAREVKALGAVEARDEERENEALHQALAGAAQEALSTDIDLKAEFTKAA